MSALQLVPTSRAEAGARLGRRAAVRAIAGRLRARLREGLLDLAELDVDPLELRRLPRQDVELDVVADRHFVEDATEVGLHDRELLQQPVALRHQLAVDRLLPRVLR